MSSLFGGDEKEAARQEDIARQNEESQNIFDQFLAQLTPGSTEFNQFQTEGGLLVSQTSEAGSQQDLIRELGSRLVDEQRVRLEAGEPITGLESRTDLAFGDLREAAERDPFEQDLINALEGLGITTPSGEIFEGVVGRAQDPSATFESTLQEQLALAEEANRASFAQRGLLRSGLEQEGATRAGNELAILETGARRSDAQEALNNFLRLFGLGEDLRGREIGVEDALVNLQLGRESNLTGLLERQTSGGIDDLVRTLTAQSQTAAGRLDPFLEPFDVLGAAQTVGERIPAPTTDPSDQSIQTLLEALRKAQSQPTGTQPNLVSNLSIT